MAAETRAGFMIGDAFYPFPTAFRLGDPVLVEELTGLAWDEFVDRLPDENDGDKDGTDPVALIGLVGVAVWQQNPRWRRERVVRFVESIDQGDFTVSAPEPEEENGGPPAPPAGGKASETSASSSGSDSDTDSESSNQGSSGTPTSPTSPEEPSE